MVPYWLKEVKGCRGSILHGQILPDSTRVRRAHPTQFTIQRRLEVTAFTPQQWRDVPEKKNKKKNSGQFDLIWKHELSLMCCKWSKKTACWVMTDMNLKKDPKSFSYCRVLQTAVEANHPCFMLVCCHVMLCCVWHVNGTHVGVIVGVKHFHNTTFSVLCIFMNHHLTPT